MVSNQFEIRHSTPGDFDAIASLYPEAFPDEDLVPLVQSLLQDAEITTSLVAEVRSHIVGHILFTQCSVTGLMLKVSLLGPLAVSPNVQRQGIGSALVRRGLDQLTTMATQLICVLGDPAYYGRFGFLPEPAIQPPFPLPDEWQGAWQSYSLGSSTHPDAGQLVVPTQWNQPQLWAP